MFRNKNIKNRAFKVITDRIDRAQKRYDDEEKNLHAKHQEDIAILKQGLKTAKENLEDELVKDVFNVR